MKHLQVIKMVMKKLLFVISFVWSVIYSNSKCCMELPSEGLRFHKTKNLPMI